MNGGKLLRWRQPIGGWRDHAGAILPHQARHAHGIEFIQVVCRNRNIAQPFQQRVARIARLFQYTLIEGEPRKLPIAETRWAFRQREGSDIGHDVAHNLIL